MTTKMTMNCHGSVPKPRTRMETITLSRLLPRVFHGMEDTERLRRSQVWLNPELTLRRGCRLCVQAESGGGKSSLLSFVYGSRQDYMGRITLGDRDAHTLGVDEWCRLRMTHIALLPQELRMFPELTVTQNLQLKNKLTRHKTTAELTDMLRRLGIEDKADTPLGMLSVGQQQRAAIARTLCQPFDFILLDEPVSHLDRDNNITVAAMIEEEATAQGAGVISTSVGNPLLLDKAECIEM